MDQKKGLKKAELLKQKEQREKERVEKDLKIPFSYVPKTKVGKQVVEGFYPDLYTLVEKERILEPALVSYFNEPLVSRIVSVDRISHTLKSGKIYQFRVVLVIGNKNGLVGVGVSKAIAKNDAIRKAEAEAKKSFISLRTLELSKKGYSPKRKTSSKLGATTVTVAPLSGNSITCSKNGKVYCELAGLTNILIYVGSKKRQKHGKVGSKMNYFKALHQSMCKQVNDELL